MQANFVEVSAPGFDYDPCLGSRLVRAGDVDKAAPPLNRRRCSVDAVILAE
jgi:hypothetical protein